jgi:hypothetical protein
VLLHLSSLGCCGLPAQKGSSPASGSLRVLTHLSSPGSTYQVFERMPGATHGVGAQHQWRGLRRQWPKVPRFDSPTQHRCSQN